MIKKISDISSEISRSAEERKGKERELIQSRQSADKIASAIGNVKLDMPEGFKLDWGISINGLKELLMGLDLTMDQIKKLTSELPSIVRKLDEQSSKQSSELKELVNAVKGIKPPHMVMPEHPKEIKVADHDKMLKLLTKLVNKPDFQKTDVSIPEFPRKITVSNLDEITEKLENLTQEAEPKQEMISFSWDKDSNGKLTTLTEVYPNGKVVSTGWNLGRVRIDDQRS